MYFKNEERGSEMETERYKKSLFCFSIAFALISGCGSTANVQTAHPSTEAASTSIGKASAATTQELTNGASLPVDLDPVDERLQKWINQKQSELQSVIAQTSGSNREEVIVILGSAKASEEDRNEMVCSVVLNGDFEWNGTTIADIRDKVKNAVMEGSSPVEISTENIVISNGAGEKLE